MRKKEASRKGERERENMGGRRVQFHRAGKEHGSALPSAGVALFTRKSPTKKKSEGNNTSMKTKRTHCCLACLCVCVCVLFLQRLSTKMHKTKEVLTIMHARRRRQRRRCCGRRC